MLFHLCLLYSDMIYHVIILIYIHFMGHVMHVAFASLLYIVVIEGYY